MVIEVETSDASTGSSRLHIYRDMLPITELVTILPSFSIFSLFLSNNFNHHNLLPFFCPLSCFRHFSMKVLQVAREDQNRKAAEDSACNNPILVSSGSFALTFFFFFSFFPFSCNLF